MEDAGLFIVLWIVVYLILHKIEIELSFWLAKRWKCNLTKRVLTMKGWVWRTENYYSNK